MPQKTPRDSAVQRAARSTPRLSRSERLDARITAEQKQLISDAAHVFGMTTTQFVIQTAVRRARAVLRDDAIIRTNERDREILINALINPPEPADALQKAWKSYEDVVRK